MLTKEEQDASNSLLDDEVATDEVNTSEKEEEAQEDILDPSAEEIKELKKQIETLEAELKSIKQDGKAKDIDNIIKNEASEDYSPLMKRLLENADNPRKLFDELLKENINYGRVKTIDSKPIKNEVVEPQKTQQEIQKEYTQKRLEEDLK